MKFRKYIPALLDNLTWILLLGVIILFAALSDRFLTPTNVWNILVHGAVLGILVIGQSFTLVTGNCDLSRAPGSLLRSVRRPACSPSPLCFWWAWPLVG